MIIKPDIVRLEIGSKAKTKVIVYNKLFNTKAVPDTLKSKINIFDVIVKTTKKSKYVDDILIDNKTGTIKTIDVIKKSPMDKVIGHEVSNRRDYEFISRDNTGYFKG